MDWNEFKKEWLNKHTIPFYVSSALLILTWSVFKTTPKTFRILTAVIFLISQVWFNVKSKSVAKNVFTKFVFWTEFVLMAALTLIYIAVSVGEGGIALGVLLGTFLGVLFIMIIISFIGVFSSTKLHSIIVSYCMFSLMIIILFGYFYALSSGFNETGLRYSNSEKNVTDTSEFLYFSSSAYYSNVIGDIQPDGYAKLIMQIETGASYVFHAIIVGFVISSISQKKSKH